MPTFQEAFLEACASSRPDVVTYTTLEIDHPSFASPAYIVANVADDMQLGIELGSSVNSGQMVTFKACPLSCGWPQYGEALIPETKVSIDNVNRELVPRIRAALTVRAYIKVIYRQYQSSDLTEPSFGPMEFVLAKVQMVAATLTGSVMIGNNQNKRFPRFDKNYSSKQFPSLLPG